MKTITGKHNSAKVYTDNIEPSAAAQIQAIVDCEVFAGSSICIMPDVHAGIGCTIGMTMTFTDRIVPNFVGVDIGCGMLTINLGKIEIDLPRFDNQVKRSVPSGFHIRNNCHPFVKNTRIDKLICPDVTMARARDSVGTLGGGNHFIELAKDDDGNVYLVIHSGSRNMGKQIAEYHQKIAISKCPDVHKDFAFVKGNDYDNYLNDMQIAQEYADWNRRAIADSIISNYFYCADTGEPSIQLNQLDQFTTTHNYLDCANKILRKGAISAQKDEIVLIPMNMRDGSIICKGLGNREWNCSAPHGAGRILGRGAAMKALNLTDFQKSMQGIYTTTVNPETLDEAPMAYKPMEEIINNIGGTVEVIKHIRPIYNFKAAEGGRGSRRRR
ncbi:MAG: RtcB family protein [Chitinispirillia bacterium]|nr:RtcB family protein [Chitinispirillia bacterium]